MLEPRGRVPANSILAYPADQLRRKCDPPEGKASKTFDAEGDFAALEEAKAWLKARGFTVGPIQEGAPIGVMLGDVRIEKWRNLDSEEREDLHGQLWTMHGRYRVGPVFLDIRDNCPRSVFEALAAEPEDVAARAAVEGSSP